MYISEKNINHLLHKRVYQIAEQKAKYYNGINEWCNCK